MKLTSIFPMSKLGRPWTTSLTKRRMSHVLFLHLCHHQTSTEAPKREMASQQITFQKYFPKTGKYRTNGNLKEENSMALVGNVKEDLNVLRDSMFLDGKTWRCEFRGVIEENIVELLNTCI